MIEQTEKIGDFSALKWLIVTGLVTYTYVCINTGVLQKCVKFYTHYVAMYMYTLLCRLSFIPLY